MTIDNPRSRLTSIGLWAGLLGPTLFAVTLLAQDLFRPDRDPLRAWVSHLSIGALGFIQVTALILLGLSLILFGVGARALLRVTRRPTPWIVVVGTGGALVAAGAFVSDPPGWRVTAEASMGTTPHGSLHDVAGTLTFLGLSLTCFLTARHVSRWWGIVAGSAVILGWIAASTLVALDYAGVLTPGFSGLAERIAMLSGLAWIAVLAVTLLRRRGDRRASTDLQR